MSQSKSGRLKVRQVLAEELAAVHECQKLAYSGLPLADLCDERLLRMQYEAFPEGFLVAMKCDQVVGYATSLIVQLDEQSPWYSYDEITGGGTFTTHNPSGDTLYGADIAVLPDHRRSGVSGRLYRARKQVLRRFNLRRMVAGGRIPGYKDVASRYSPEEYVELVVQGKLEDQSLKAHLKAGYQVRGIHMGYLHDEQSLDFATLLEYENPHFNAQRRRIAAAPLKRPVRKVRVCAAQMQTRDALSFEGFCAQNQFFLTTAEAHHCHFLVLPEIPTFHFGQTLTEVAQGEQRYLDFFKEAATRTSLFILAGTHPVERNGEITMAAHLFTPGGNVYRQDKLHLTPEERAGKQFHPGRALKVFDTGYARIGILVGYDVVFPELARLQTLAGAEIIFVPYWARERNEYLRIRHTAQARSVENVLYLVLAGRSYGESVILTPCDFGFPQDGVAASSSSYGDHAVIFDLDLGALIESREHGTVRPLRDRRRDSWGVAASEPVEQIRTF
jgi:predicted amidohydrolase/GNAT superfamily N-acetyltransferase